ncbi:DivIVA domain-containing protein [Bombilactobacillus thymidiniphilus]|uniref:DivIVA domain-containing protein n=1 Tax=Bombilactobacillus thymidiniphilus TaxID=2923363 RepID=A0ABY4PDT6_9LACO|nr:DivIVA domain-containing protein [Bombilactobacillus thymidiniphilus]UQS83785.1 DivIVA domain-containing protein [Bombilactobacillus thymidiniphilus]
MVLTPNDIQMKDFHTQLRGYEKEQVNQYLEQVADAYSEQMAENHRLEYELKDAQAKIEYFNNLQNTVNESIIVAQNAADQVKTQADNKVQAMMAQTRVNTENMVDEAIQQGRQIIQDAQRQAQELIEQTKQLQGQIQNHYDSLQHVVADQRQLLDSDTWKQLITNGSGQLADNIQQQSQAYLQKLDQLAQDVKADNEDLVVEHESVTQSVDKATQNVDNQD